MISVIIPAYNEEQALPATLQRLAEQGTEHEVIVVDGGSADRTCEIARSTARVQLLFAPKGRAAQMNAGARIARGEWLLFLHADTCLPINALRKITDSAASVQAGGFKHRFSGQDWRLRLISGMNNLRCRITRVIYGDQALFVRRHLFERLGGFSEQAIVEDVALCEKLLRVTRPVILDEYAITDARKFIKHGVWRSFMRVAAILIRVQFRLPIRSKTFFEDVR